MIPILYRPEETEFRTNGLGRLVDCISCEVTEERNGVYECTFQYPITGRHYSDIKENCIIAVIHDDKKDIQPFDIYKRTAPIDGVVTFYAHHISYRLRKIAIRPYTAGTCMEAITAIPNNSVNTNPFTFWTDKSVTSQFSLTAPRVAKDLLSGSAGSILDVYGKGEYEYDKFSVKLYLNRGSDNGVQIRYGKNMTDITQDIDAGDTYSAIVPYWAGSDGTVVTLPENVVVSDETEVRLTPITTETRMVITDGDGNPIEAGYSVIEPVVLDMTQDFAEKPTEEQLREKARSKLISSSPWLPTENIKVDFTALWQTPDYDAVAPLQRVSLCDVVSVFFPKLGVNAVKQKVISVTYDVLLERYSTIELGTSKEIYTDIITEKAIQELRKVVPTTAAMQTAIENATQLIKGGLGGHVVIGTDADGKPNEILIMDTEDKLTAVHVWRFNANGWGYSSTGYDGTYTTAATLDGGFVADFITTGILNASLLKTGIITDTKGKNYWNLETGDISISLDPGEIGAVTTADLERVQNNAQTYANNAEANAKSYTDSTLGNYDTAEAVSGKIEATAEGLRTEFSGTYAKSSDTISDFITYYYQSTSPTQLFGGQWSTTPPAWKENMYMWTKRRVINADGSYEDSDPVCVSGARGATGATGAAGAKGEKGDKGDTGATGAAGTPGAKGDKGDKGSKGDKGDTGATGASGVSIKTITNYYLATNASSGVTTSTAGWTTTIQSITSAKPYLWNYEKVIGSDNSTLNTTTPVIIGRYGTDGAKGDKGDTGATGAKGDKGDIGATGATGKGIKSIVEHYAKSSSNSTAPTSWSSSVTTMDATNRYLWNYETITFTDNSSSDTNKRVIGTYGDKGNKGDKGDTGATGPQGPTGAKGDKGDKGDKGETGPQGEQGDPGEDATYVYITSDKSTATAREVASTVKLTAIVCKGEETDIDPQGYTYHYAWTQAIDNQAEKFAGKGRTYTITIDDNYCDEKAGVSVALVPTSYFWITNENNVRIEDGNGNPIEVA